MSLTQFGFKKSRVPEDEEIRERFRTLDVSNYNNKRVFLQANAGAGKTTLIMDFLKNHREYNICIISYTNSVVQTVKRKLKKAKLECESVTFDGLCKRNKEELVGRIPWHVSEYSQYTALTIYKESIGDKKSKLLLDEHHQKFIDDHEEMKKLYNYCKRTKKSNVHSNLMLLYYKYVYREFDIFIIDEAQDLSKWKRRWFVDTKLPFVKAKIFVGDPKQSLYCDYNIFDTIKKEDEHFKLTHTYRYGSDLIKYLNIRGYEYHTTFKDKRTRIHESIEIKDCIHKVDFILVSAWKHVLNYLPYLLSKKCMIYKKGKDKIVEEIKNHKQYLLWKDKWLTNNPKKLDQMKYFTENGKEHLFDYIDPKWEEMEAFLNLEKEKAPCAIATVHQLKGLEGKNIYLDISCYPQINSNPGSIRGKDNIFYVALTRAQYSVSLPRNRDFYHPYHYTLIEMELKNRIKKCGSISEGEFESFCKKNRVLDWKIKNQLKRHTSLD